MPIAGQGSNNLNTIRMDYTARRFDTFVETLTIEYYDDDGVLQEVDLTGATVQMQLKRRKNDATPFFSLDTSISGNTITISKNRLHMDLPKGKYWYDMEVKDADDNHITWVEGRFIVLEHITQYIDTRLQEIGLFFKNIISILTIPKKRIYTFFSAIVGFARAWTYKYKALWSILVAFETLVFPVKEYITSFVMGVTIAVIPKYQYFTSLVSRVSVVTYVAWYGDVHWRVKVGFTPAAS